MGRAPFEVHPGKESSTENLWVEVLTWDDEGLVGKLVEGGQLTTEWRRGAHVQLDEEHINAIALGKDGRTLEDEEMPPDRPARRSGHPVLLRQAGEDVTPPPPPNPPAAEITPLAAAAALTGA